MIQQRIATLRQNMTPWIASIQRSPWTLLSPAPSTAETPLALTLPASEAISAARIEQLAGLFLLLGLLARIIRYYLCFPLWDDESFLCVNFIDRSYAELLKPLDYHQVAPLLFLWAERTSVLLFGYSEYSLRLFPFVCSIGSLFLFQRVASWLLSGISYLFAIALFAVSYPGIRYAAEAKPYCTDMFASLILLALTVSWIRNHQRARLWQLAALTPLLLGLSYPTVFTAGGLSVVLAAVMWSRKSPKAEWLIWFAWNCGLVVSFGFWFLLIGKTQTGAEGEFMGEYWKSNFPPIATPWMVPWWILKIHASDFLAYPFGGPNWASSGTLILCSVGLFQIIRQRQFVWLGLIIGPAGLHFVAAALQRYPYGGHVKFSQYLSAMICCLAAVGLSECVRRGIRKNEWAYGRIGWTCVALFLIGGTAVARDLINPFKTRSDYRARAFAQSFWIGAHAGEEVTCLKSDWKIDLVPEQHRELSWSAHYLCNRAIEVSRHRLAPADLKRVSGSHPLRCVFYQDARYPIDQEQLDHWLAEMDQNYQLISEDHLPFPRFAKDDRRLLTMEYVNSYRFIPRGETGNGLPSVANGTRPLPH